MGSWPGPNSQQGNTVIHAEVRARLLGMQLLTLEARVIVESDVVPRAASSLHASFQAPTNRGYEPSAVELSSGLGARYARAIELLEQGTKTLNRSQWVPPDARSGVADDGRPPPAR